MRKIPLENTDYARPADRTFPYFIHQLYIPDKIKSLLSGNGKQA